MKKLYLIRHAEAAPASATQRDRDRPLNERGRHEAGMMAARLAFREPGFGATDAGLIVSSPAVRALSTARLFADALGVDRLQVGIVEALYSAEPETVLDVVHAFDDGRACALLFGHNPGLTELAQRFARTVTHLPTCAIAGFDFAVASWGEVGLAPPARSMVESPGRA